MCGCVYECVLFVDKQHLHVFYTFYWDMCHNPLFFLSLSLFFFFLMCVCEELVNQTDIQEIGLLPARFQFAVISSWWLPEKLLWRISDCQIMVVISTSVPSLPFCPFLTGQYPCFLPVILLSPGGQLWMWPCCLLSLWSHL